MSRQLITDIAIHEIGTMESPAGSNIQKYGEWFGLNGQEWCGIFCSWVYDHAGLPLGPLDFTRGFASVPFMFQHAKKLNLITQNPKPGDLVIYDWKKGDPGHVMGDWTPEHVGIFLQWIDKSAGTFYTIEGNTSAGSQSNGGQVQKRQRNMAFVQAFINPKNLE